MTLPALLVLAAIVQQPDQSLPPASIVPHAIQGQVIDSVTSQPIARALVQIGGQFATLTDHEGRFTFSSVTGESAPPFAMKPGYFAENRGFHRRQSLIATEPANSTSSSAGDQEIVLKLVPEAVITGTVTGQNGEPLQGIPVMLKTLAVSNGLNRWSQRHQTTTDADGRFRFAELEAGRYALSTAYHIEGLPDSNNAIAYVPAQYPPGATSQPDSALNLAPGDHAEANINPIVEKLYPVDGQISGYGESRGVGFGIKASNGETLDVYERFNERTGEFHLMLPGGAYQATATAWVDRGPLRSNFSITVPQGPVRGVTVALEPPATVPVEIEMQSVAGSNSTASQRPFVNLSLITADSASDPLFLGSRPVHKSGEENTTSNDPTRPQAIDSVPPGRYLLDANLAPPWYISAAYCGGLDLTHEELVINGAAAGCTIRAILRNDAASIHGTLRSSDNTTVASNSETFIYLVPIGDVIRHIIVLTTRSNEFSADNLAPGRYLAFALDHRAELPYREPEVLQRYTAIAQEVTLTPSGKSDIELGPTLGDL